MARPRKKPLAAGNTRWVHWDRRGRERDHEVEPDDLPMLKVEVTAVEGVTITEMTWTRFPLMPLAAALAGWVMADREGSGARWIRRRMLK